jgi:hypothetical protein
MYVPTWLSLKSAIVFSSRSLEVVASLMGNSLVDMYAKCGNLEDVWKVFNELSIPFQNVVN